MSGRLRIFHSRRIQYLLPHFEEALFPTKLLIHKARTSLPDLIRICWNKTPTSPGTKYEKIPLPQYTFHPYRKKLNILKQSNNSVGKSALRSSCNFLTLIRWNLSAQHMSILIQLVTEFLTKLVFDRARGLWALEYEIPKPIAVPSARLAIISTFFTFVTLQIWRGSKTND
jgi:hypothetical protein